MNTPRYLFVLGIGEGESARPMWPDLHQPFQGEADVDGSWYAWRLTGANHRELGRSCRVFADLRSARDAATTLRERVQDAEVTVLAVPRTGAWGWRLQLDGVAVATSSRSYARHRECIYNANTFVAAAGIAALTDSDPPPVWQLAETLHPDIEP